MFSVLTEGCHVGYSREFVGTVYYTYGQSNATYATELPYLPHVLYLHMTVHNDKHLPAGNSGTK